MKRFFLVSLFALFTFYSCNEDTFQDVQNNQEELITPNSTLANLMTFTSSNDGSVDDILDNADCFSINLPVTITVNNITITINTLDDLELIEDVIAEFENDDDLLEFLFPITITLNDFTEVIIENEEQLEDFIEDCFGDEEVIECVDFQYPISFSIYNTDFQVIDTITIENDEELYEFLESLEDGENGVVLASLNFPVTLVYANGETIEVNNNQELEEAINAAEEDCDDEDECEVDDIVESLMECFNAPTLNGFTPAFTNFSFLGEGVLSVVYEGDLIFSGTWEVDSNDDGEIYLELSIQGLEDYNGVWLLVNCDDDNLQFIQGDDTLSFAQNCEDDESCNAQEINASLLECVWYSGTNLLGNDLNGPYNFDEGGVLTVETPNGGLTTGTWDVILTDEGVFLDLFLVDDYAPIALLWKAVECDGDRLEFVNGDNTLVFEQDCSVPEFDCFESREVVVCDDDDDVIDGIYAFDLDAIYADCNQENVTVTFHQTQVDAENSVNQFANPYTNTANPEGIYARVELLGDPSVFEVFEIWLIVEICNDFSCFNSFEAEIVECDTDGDGFAEFNFTQVYANCITDQTIISYYETQADADSNMNQLPLEGYVNNANPQTIYVRVEIGSEVQIFTMTLIVEDCSNAACSEQEVDAYLVECTWNVVNFNGSDDLIVYNMDFEANSGIVVIYTDTETIDASWSTSQTNDGVVIEFSNVAGANIQAISGEWLVVDCDPDRLELVNNSDEMIMERNCL